MNVLSRRFAARVGVCAVAVVAAGFFATPAFADTTSDLGVEITGTTIAAGTEGKFVSITLTNNGPSPATGVSIVLDLGLLDDTQVTADTEGCTEHATKLWFCPVPDDQVPVPGTSKKFGEFLELTATAVPGSAGILGVGFVQDGQDEIGDNNTDNEEITIGGKGPDLMVTARDVDKKLKLDGDGFPVFEDDSLVYDGPLTPGSVSAVEYVVRNQGNASAAGFISTIELPEHVSFAEINSVLPCEQTDARHAECNWPLPTVPADEDTPGGEETSAWLVVAFIQVDDGVTAPATLPDGAITVAPVASIDAPARRSAAPGPLLATPMTEDEIDVDPTDNSDAFAVLVSNETSGGGGSLPITGVQAGLIGGAGLAAVVTGGVLFVVARRRRVVMVSPTE